MSNNKCVISHIKNDYFVEVIYRTNNLKFIFPESVIDNKDREEIDYVYNSVFVTKIIDGEEFGKHPVPGCLYPVYIMFDVIRQCIYHKISSQLLVMKSKKRGNQKQTYIPLTTEKFLKMLQLDVPEDERSKYKIVCKHTAEIFAKKECTIENEERLSKREINIFNKIVNGDF